MKEALAIYKKCLSCQNEIARTLYKMGTIYQDVGDLAEGRTLIDEAESLRREIQGSKWNAATCEDDFDQLVRFWSR